MNKRLGYLILIPTLFVFQFCSDKNEVTPTGMVEFSIFEKHLGGGRIDNADAVSVIISITRDGELVFENEEISLTWLGDTFLLDPILLEFGEYSLTKFLVLNSEEEIIFATPLKGSVLASFVENPLPINFSIESDAASKIVIEVINTASIDPEDLGYASLSFTINPTKEILVSVLAGMQGGFDFIASDLTVYGDLDSLYSTTLGDSINVIKLRTDFENFTLVFSSYNFIDKEIEVPVGDLDIYRTIPLQIIMEKEGPTAYFPLDGNTDEMIGSSIVGVINGAIVSADRNNVLGGAYNFDGLDDHINFGDNLDLGTSEFTVSIWTKVEDFKGLLPGSGSSGAYMLAKGITLFGTPSRAGYALKSQKINDENHLKFLIGGETNEVFTVSHFNNYLENVWYHVVGRRLGDKITLFVNGVLVAEETVPSGLNTETNIPLSMGRIDKLGNDPTGTTHFDGSIDEVKIYDRALSDEEILILFQDN